MRARGDTTAGRAVIAARDDERVPNTNEIRGLVEATGSTVVAEVRQRRREDGTYNLGRGKAEELATLTGDVDADLVVFDGSLDPGQYASLLDLLPDEIGLVDRYRLVLDIFADGAGSRVAKLQVERATLQYDLPRLRRATEESLLNQATEKGSPVLDVERRIDAIDRELADARDRAAARRAERREEGFDLIAVAGYTNAGKSTLLHRLADDLSVADHEPAHGDVAGTAEVEDRLFKTLETTTRRATVAGRRTLVTDTVGLVDDLPHDLVRSFSATLGEIADADAVLAVVDASAPPAELRRRLSVTMDVLAREADGTVIPVLNKVDRIDEGALSERRDLVRGAAPDAAAPVAVSAREGTGIDELLATVADALPSERVEFTVPSGGDAQALLSWLHDRGDVEATYGSERIHVAFVGKPSVVGEAERRAGRLTESGEVDG